MLTTATQRLRLRVRGVVQGVGFRPFAYRLATELGLAGWVRNTSEGALVEAEGPSAQLDAFIHRLRRETPAPSVIDELEARVIAPRGEAGFAIRDSLAPTRKTAWVLPDLATCAACRAETFDPRDRRFRYPFTNCTHCGPRFSIITALPYDRPNTTMRAFTMCAACRAEYDEPADRRFHAQPNACPRCGPRLALWDERGRCLSRDEAALRASAAALARGAIIAAKGLGGFHLLVAAGDEEAVRRLRRRKRREEKPFALMEPSLETAQAHADVSALEAALLTSVEAPVVLVHRRAAADGAIAASVAPRTPLLGLMLPATPLHHLLLREVGRAVVATSGNRSDEPICIDEREALRRLRGIADVWLVHDRPIARHVDDSVARVVMDRALLLRRARGYAPLPVARLASAHPVMAFGAHLKNTVAVAVGGRAMLSQHLGDLDTPQAAEAFQRSSAQLPRLYEAAPEAVACDAHPDYYSTAAARRMGVSVVAVQHHEAHVRACMTEHGVGPPVLGVAWDGTGYGADGTIWGGEWLRVTPQRCERVAHLRPFPLPGGERAIREPRRTAIGLLYALAGEAAFGWDDLEPLRRLTAQERAWFPVMLRRGINSPMTSSVGRLFDAVSSLAGVCHANRFEGQAAVELEYALEGAATEEAYPVTVAPCPLAHARPEPRASWDVPEAHGHCWVDWAPMVKGVVADVRARVAAGVIAAKFHNGLVDALIEAARRSGETVVCLSGGCFQNRYLTERAVTQARRRGWRVWWPERVPPNDGGISLGQLAAVAR